MVGDERDKLAKEEKGGGPQEAGHRGVKMPGEVGGGAERVDGREGEKGEERGEQGGGEGRAPVFTQCVHPDDQGRGIGETVLPRLEKDSLERIGQCERPLFEVGLEKRGEVVETGARQPSEDVPEKGKSRTDGEPAKRGRALAAQDAQGEPGRQKENEPFVFEEAGGAEQNPADDIVVLLAKTFPADHEKKRHQRLCVIEGRDLEEKRREKSG